jgi:hypothetical protein
MIASRDPEFPIRAARSLSEHPSSSARLDAGFSDIGINDTGISVVAIWSGAQSAAASRGIP